MKIEELEVPKTLATALETDVLQLNPVQIDAIKAGLLKLDKSFVIASPTASGKTLIAELMMIKAILEKHCKAIYVVPLRALANEKYARFKEKYGKLGIKVAISTGDFDSIDFWLADYDLIILTSEKTDSLLRHKAAFLHQVGVAVIDECHLITDVGRGPTLEIAITRLKKLNPKMLFLLLSATIANANELADWLNAKLVKSNFRPVKLHEGVYFDNQLYFDEKPSIKIDGDDNAEVLLAENTAKMGKQALVFASSRRNAEAIAERCSKALKKTLTTDEISNSESYQKILLEP